LTGTNLLARGYEWGLELLAARTFVPGTFSSTFAYYGLDGHGSVRFLTNASGVITDTYDYDAFGNLVSSTGTTFNNYLFAGEQFDPALGIYYNRARYYDQRQGRFWTADTWQGDPDSPISLHKYLYASANSVNGIDPSGNLTILEEEEEQAEGQIIDVAPTIGVYALIASLFVHHDFLLNMATDSSQVPLAVALAIQSRVISPQIKEKLRRRFGDYVFFVHGTSAASAADINVFGVSSDKILAGGRGSNIPGAFYAFMLLPDPVKAVQLAIEFSFRKPSPHAVLVGGLPATVFEGLVLAGQAKVEPLLGAGYDETYFLPPSFPVLDSYNQGR
jgi:RHS repeat-associated protein